MAHDHRDVPLRLLGWCAMLQVFGFAVGFVALHFTHSATLFSDWLHWLADTLPAVLTWLIRLTIQARRRNGQRVRFQATVLASGTFNAATLIVVGGLSIWTAVHQLCASGPTLIWPAFAAAVLGLLTNWYGHRLLSAYTCHQHHGAIFDVIALERHLFVDTLLSAMAIIALGVNLVWHLQVLDAIGGLLIGSSVLLYGLLLTIAGWLRRHEQL